MCDKDSGPPLTEKKMTPEQQGPSEPPELPSSRKTANIVDALVTVAALFVNSVPTPSKTTPPAPAPNALATNFGC